MRKRPYSVSTVAILALLLGILGWSSRAKAQDSGSPDTQTPAPQTQPAPETQPQPTPDAPTPAPETPTQQSPDQPAQQAPNQAQPGQPGNQPSPDTQAQSPDSTAVQTFTGTVARQGDKYVLKDASGTTYDIDHQDEVKKFDGKQVKVRGTLDSTGKMIHVQ